MKKPKNKIDMQEIMEIYKKVGTPGEPHKLLAKLEGSWTTRSRSWTEPGKPPIESIGTCEQKPVLDGHYLQQVYTGDMMGTPFTGINIMGYNNHTKKYESIWLDSFSTAIYFFAGKGSADGKTITQDCSYDDPERPGCLAQRDQGQGRQSPGVRYVCHPQGRQERENDGDDGCTERSRRLSEGGIERRITQPASKGEDYGHSIG